MQYFEQDNQRTRYLIDQLPGEFEKSVGSDMLTSSGQT